MLGACIVATRNVTVRGLCCGYKEINSLLGTCTVAIRNVTDYKGLVLWS